MDNRRVTLLWSPCILSHLLQLGSLPSVETTLHRPSLIIKSKSHSSVFILSDFSAAFHKVGHSLPPETPHLSSQNSRSSSRVSSLLLRPLCCLAAECGALEGLILGPSSLLCVPLASGSCLGSCFTCSSRASNSHIRGLPS